MATASKKSAAKAAPEVTAAQATEVFNEVLTQEDAARTARIGKYVDALLAAKVGGFKEVGEQVRFSLSGANCRLYVKLYRNTGNSYVTVYSVDGKAQLGEVFVSYGKDGKAAIARVNELRKSGNVRRLLSGPDISIDEAPVTQLSLPVEQLGTEGEAKTEVVDVTAGQSPDEVREEDVSL